jgi:hypothetical protein
VFASTKLVDTGRVTAAHVVDAADVRGFSDHLPIMLDLR